MQVDFIFAAIAVGLSFGMYVYQMIRTDRARERYYKALMNLLLRERFGDKYFSEDCQGRAPGDSFRAETSMKGKA